MIGLSQCGFIGLKPRRRLPSEVVCCRVEAPFQRSEKSKYSVCVNLVTVQKCVVARALCPLLKFSVVGDRSIMVNWQTTLPRVVAVYASTVGI